MFELGFTVKDVVRSVWVFLAAFVVTMAGYDGEVTSSLLWGAVAAGLIAVKNFVLADGSIAKG